MELEGEGGATGRVSSRRSEYRVVAKRSRKVTGQRFFVSIVAGNGEPLFRSEMYRDKDHAVETAQTFAKLLKGTFVNAT